MSRFPLLRGAMCSAFILAASGLPAAEVTLTDFQVSSNGATEAIVFIASGEVECSLHSQENPARLILQFPRVRSQVRERPLPPGLKILAGLELQDSGDVAPGSTRAVLNLRQPAQVEIGRSPGRVTVVLRPAVVEAPAAAVAPAEVGPLGEVISLYLAPSPAGAPAAAAGDRASGPPAAAAADPALGPQDLLQVRVLGVEALERRARIASDGTITLPLVGSVHAAGRTAAQLEQEIARLLAGSFVKDPQVSVFVEEYRSRRVSVSGAVERAGSFEILRPTTLLEALALAGGILSEEAGPRIQIVRPGGQEAPGGLEVDVAALQGGDMSHNLRLAPGDLVHVPFDEMLEVHVQGKVARPDRYRLRRSSVPTLLRAVLLAGGLAGNASGRRVELVRRGTVTPTRTLMINLQRIREGKDLDIPLEPDDIIVVR